MKTERMIGVWAAMIIFWAVGLAEEDSTVQDHPIYKYGYVIAHKEGGSQAHVETRNGNMTLGRYYVNFPNGSGQKVTYLADDVGFHTGIVYSSHTKKGSSKTQIAMGHKGLATLDALEVTPRAPTTINSATPYGITAAKSSTISVTVKPEDQSNVTFPFTKGFYLLRKPIESSTAASNRIPLKTKSQTVDSDVQQSKANVQHTTYSLYEKVPLAAEHQIQILQPLYPQINGYLTVLKQNPNVVNTAVRHQQQPHRVPMYSSDKSIEKTILTDVDAQLISKIQKHADGIIMNDLKKKQPPRLQSQEYSSTPKSTLTVTMQPIIVTAGGSSGIQKTTFSPDLRKSNKNVQSDSINSLRISEKANGDQVSKTSGVVEVSVNVTKPVKQFSDTKVANRHSGSANFTLCDSKGCIQDSNRASSDSVVAVKLSTDMNHPAEVLEGRSERKLPLNFYPKNRLRNEMHFVTTIDVQKGISLEVQQNEDGSIRLANDFPFNKLPNHQRPYGQSTLAPILSNSITPPPFSSTQNVHLTPEKPFLANSVTKSPEAFDSGNHLTNVPGGHTLHQPQNQENVEFYYQPVSSGITQIMTDQFANPIKQSSDSALHNHQQPQIIYNVSPQPQLQIDEERKQNFIEEERKEYFENLQKVEEIKKQNSVTARPAVDIHSNNLLEDVTASPLIQVETNSLKTTSPEIEQQVQYVPEVQTAGYQEDISSYAAEVPVTYPTAQQVRTPVVYQKPLYTYETQYASAETEAPETTGSYYEPQHVQNVFIDNSIQQTTQTNEKIDLGHFAKITQGTLAPSFTYPQQVQAQEKVERIQPLAIRQEHVNPLSLNIQPQYLRQPKTNNLDKTILLNPLTMINYGRGFKVEQPISFLETFPMQLQSGSEHIAVHSVYQFPQQYHLSLPIQLPQSTDLSAPFPTSSFSASSSGGQYQDATSYKPNQNKLRVQPLKPSPPAEEENQTPENIQQPVVLTQQQAQFNPTYFYAGFPTINRLQLRHVGRQKPSNFDQVAAQSLARREKSLKNLKIEYGFKPPLRPSVEFTEVVKPSVYGPSVPIH